MGSPTTATGPTNVYVIFDDYGTSAGPPGGTTGGASGALMIEFVAGSVANAAQVAHIVSSGLQRPVRWGVKYGASAGPPFTLMAGVGAATAITSCPSGVSY